MIKQTSHWKNAGSRLRGLRKDSSAVVALITAITFPVLLAFAALALDVGRLQDLKRRQKNAAIAGALAAGHEMWLVHSDDDASPQPRRTPRGIILTTPTPTSPSP